MGRKSGNLSDEISQEKAACPGFSKDDVSPSPLEIRACSDRRHTSSETSNPLSVSSSHDSSIENEESKAIPRVSDASEGISMLLKAAVSHAAAEDEGFLEPKFFCGNKTISNQLEMKKVSECNGDDTSCISGPESPNMSGDHRCDIDRKNVSCSSASVSSFLPRGLEKAVDVQIASSVQDSSNYEVKEGHNCSCRPTKFAREQGTAPFSGKSEKGEVSSLRDVHNTGAKSLKGDLSECSKEQEKSSFVRVATVSLDGHKHDALDIVESVKPKTEVNEEGDPSTVAKKHLDQNEDLVLPEVPDVQGPPEQSQTVMGSGESDLLIDVKVCDICGDAGREDFLATCSKCSDGAEHTYCMRVRLEKVPEGNWMCEDCLLQEEIEKQNQNKLEKVGRTPQGPSSNKNLQNAGNLNTNIRTCVELDTKGSDVEKSRRDKVGSISRICAKRPAGNLEFDSITKRRALETSVGSPRMSNPCKKSPLSQGSLHKNVDNVKVKPTCHVPTFSERSPSSMISFSNSPKSQTNRQISRGLLTKSNSFNIPDLKLKVQAPGEDILGKQKFSLETAASDNRKPDIVRRMSKSLSFNNVSSSHSKVADSKTKMFSSNNNLGKDLKRFANGKEHDLSPKKYKARLDNPPVSSQMAGSCISASRNDKVIASHPETMSPRSGTKCYPKPVQSHGNSNIPLKRKFHLAHEGSNYQNNGQDGSVVAKKLQSCVSKVVGVPSSFAKSNSSRELKPNVVTGKDGFKRSASLAAGRHCNSSDLTGPKSPKVEKTSYFSSAREHILAGNKSAHSRKCENIDEAIESCPVTSPQASVPETKNSKEANRSNYKDCGPIFCDQTNASSILAIPKLDFIWKGGFEIQSSRRLPSFCYGIQAHLSTCASPKVPEVVKKFPCKVLLEEVSRSSVWPTQFLENHPKEDSIGVYFFAQDVASYEGNYRSLMECMINHDLALKGDVDGIELLIFSSNLLPEKSQRWNTLFFLWGVFRGRRVSNEQTMPSSQDKPSIHGSSNVCSGQDLSTGIKNMCSSGKPRECLSASKLFYNTQKSSSSTDPQELQSVFSCGRDGNYEHQQSSREQKCSHLQTKFDQRSSADDAIPKSIPMQNQLCRDMQHTVTSQKEFRLPERKLEDYQPSLQASNYNMDCVSWSGGKARSMEVTDNSRTTYGSPFSSAEPGPVDGMLGLNSSRWQVLTSDCKDSMKSEFLDLGLSLGFGKESEKQALVPAFNGVVDNNNNRDMNPNSIASDQNNHGVDDKFSPSVELALTLSSYDK
ncbi:hypothetical protein CsSME_00049812 [Camellia sinensis var. sinensis]